MKKILILLLETCMATAGYSNIFIPIPWSSPPNNFASMIGETPTMEAGIGANKHK